VKRTIISLLAVVLLLFLALPVNMLAAPPPAVRPADSDFSPQEIVVGFKAGTTLPQMAMVHRQAGGRVQDTIPAIGAQVVTIPAGTVGQSIRRYTAHPWVTYAEPNYIAEVVAEPNDPYFSAQWGLHKVEASAAWDTTTGSAGVSIAILDTGVDQNHPDLSDKIAKNVNFTDSTTVDDVHGHGTHVAGIAAASTNNAIGVAGLGYDSTIMNVKVLGDSGSGYYSWVVSGITWAADNGAQVINMSLGGTASSRALEDAINYAWSKGVIVVAAAGNGGTSSPFYPAYYANCIAVAATDRYDARASWSNYGDWVDVAAPGVSIYATLKGSSYGYKSGTSMASPHVAGLAALVFTAVTDSNGNGHLNDEVRSSIESTCDDIGVSGIGSGRINAARAVARDDTQPQPDVNIVTTAEPTPVSQAGDVITCTYTVTNTGEVTLTGIAVTDNKLGNISLATTTLAPGASTTTTATYTVTQADIDAGADIVNTATVTTDQGVTDSDSATVAVVQEPDVNIVTTADRASVSQAGDVISYTYTVTNTGQVTLTGIAVTDNKLGDISLATTTLAPGASTTATATYTVTQADIDTGDAIVSTTTVTTDQVVTDSDSATVAVEVPEFAGVAISPADSSQRGWPGEDVVYVFTVQNTGDVADTYAISVSSGWISSVTPQSLTLEPGGASATITVTHTVPEGVAPGDSDAGTVQVLSAQTGASASAAFATTVEEEQEPATPVIDVFTVSDRSNRVWAWVTVDWAVSDADGNLATVEIVMVLDGRIVDSASFSVAGYDASGSCPLRHRGGQSNNYEIILIVTDTDGNTASQTRSISLQEKASTRSR
jgi:thermitase